MSSELCSEMSSKIRVRINQDMSKLKHRLGYCHSWRLAGFQFAWDAVIRGLQPPSYRVGAASAEKALVRNTALMF